jgi:DNA-binding beta-propeller fold protein YncE
MIARNRKYLTDLKEGDDTRRMLLLILLFATTAAAVQGCREAGVTEVGTGSQFGSTYIVNEGVFGGGGGISRYDPKNGGFNPNAVRNARGWLFPNDIAFHSGKMYVAVNGADRVDVIDPLSDSVRREIAFPAFSGPGFLAEGNGGLYVANYDGSVSLIDPLADTLMGKSPKAVGFPGGMALSAGYIFLSDAGLWPDTGRWVRVLDAATLTAVDSFTAGDGPGKMVVSSGRIFVAATVSRKIYSVDARSFLTVDSAEVGGTPGDLALWGTSLFVMTGNSVERIDIGSFRRDPDSFIVNSDGLYFYALGLDGQRGELYLSKIIGGGGTGEIEIFTLSGTRVRDTFVSGIFPGAFGFYHPTSYRTAD